MKLDIQAQKTLQILFNRMMFFLKKIQVDQLLEKFPGLRKNADPLDIPNEELYKPFTSWIAQL